MDPSDEPPDDLRVRLRWPGPPDGPAADLGRPLDPIPDAAEVSDGEVDYPAAEDRRSPTGAAEPDDQPQAITSQQLILAARSDSLQAALASIALRIDALTSTTSTFRNLVSDRLTDYSEQVGRLAAGAASDLDDYRHLHERSLEQIRRSAAAAEDNLRQLSRTVTELEQKTGALVAAVRENGDAVDHMLSERDQVSDSLLRSLDRVGVQVQTGLAQGLGEATASLARLEEALAEVNEGRDQSLERLDEIVEAMIDDRERQQATAVQIEQSVAALADDREQGADALGRLEQAITHVSGTHDRGLTSLASRIEARMDQLAEAIAEAVNGAAGDTMPAVLTRLDARLKELSTELVSGRDRATAKALGQLSAQLDGLAGMIAESRTEREPVEARVNRLARAAAPPLDLTELYARLDEMAGELAQFAPPDLRDLHLHIDELAQTLTDRLSGPDPKLTGVVERLERLLPTLDTAQVRRGRLGEPTAEAAAVAEAVAAAAEGRRELLDRLDQLGQDLGGQIEALRRRIALRARPATPELDDQAIAAIADAVIARLGATEPPDFRPPDLRPAPPAPPALARPARPTGAVVSGEQRRRGTGRP